MTKSLSTFSIYDCSIAVVATLRIGENNSLQLLVLNNFQQLFVLLGSCHKAPLPIKYGIEADIRDLKFC